jgi:hypothetical protein
MKQSMNPHYAGHRTARLAHIQRARLITDQGEEMAAGLARLDFGARLTAALVHLEPLAPLIQAVARGRREYHLELEQGITLPARVIGSTAIIGRGVCLLQILSAPIPSYSVGHAWNELRDGTRLSG